jgi:hypothetical protein
MDYPHSVPNVNLLAGKFTDGNPGTGVPASLDPSAWANAVTDSILDVQAAAGLAPVEGDATQLLTAIKTIVQQETENYAVDSGVANAYVGVYSPVIAAYTNGLTLRFKAAHANTGPSTFNGGAGVVNLVDDDGNALIGGALPAGSIVTAVYDAVANAFFAVSIASPALGAWGQCYLSVSGGNLVLKPYNGNRLTINGVVQTIPAAGVTLAPAGLAAPRTDVTTYSVAAGVLTVTFASAHGFNAGDTIWFDLQSPVLGGNVGLSSVTPTTISFPTALPNTGATAITGRAGKTLWVYAFMNAGVMTLEAVNTTHATDATTGVEIKNGDSTRTLVGLCVTSAGPTFVDAAAARNVASWFNPKPKTAIANFTAQRATASTVFIEINQEIRNTWVTFGDRQQRVVASGEVSNSSTGLVNTGLGLDGALQEEGNAGTITVTATGQSMGFSGAHAAGEGFHYCTLLGAAGAGTANWGGGSTPVAGGTAIVTLETTIWG